MSKERERIERVVVEVIFGVEGPCLAIDDLRVAGPKPWGGGTVVYKWEIDRDKLLAALRGRGKQ